MGELIVNENHQILNNFRNKYLTYLLLYIPIKGGKVVYVLYNKGFMGIENISVLYYNIIPCQIFICPS